MLSAIAFNVAGYRQQVVANCANSMSWKGMATRSAGGDGVNNNPFFKNVRQIVETI
ncbi:hypothetical protein GTP91_25600 [Rugamonas sp. FT82W]|uniref:Uncharacterized protein n=1 Tax=Duganella vulcania TaxID=2692166 RepID=A0A845GAV9_9BURK|nr:hypothetical protein [Duganella vulcania]MYM90535.1 hypothetical protein [Duganella vulcania]